MGEIVLVPNNETTIFCFTDSSTEKELSDYFSYTLPSAKFMKQGWRKHWDGKIRLYSKVTKTIAKGLLPRLLTWADKQNYPIENKILSTDSQWTPTATSELFEKYPVKNLEIRDYQETAITWALTKQRCVLISPTGSGKSLILYYIVRARMTVGPILLVVPTVSLVSQMASDWEQYGWSKAQSYIHKITAGISKDTKKPIIISTWQSLLKQPPEYFKQFKTLLQDECHLLTGKSLSDIANKMTHCSFKVGVTGTLDDAKAHRLVVEGALGKGYRVAKTVDLQAKGQLSPIIVQGHYLKYSDSDKHLVNQAYRDYQDEIDFIVRHKPRMDWLVKFIGKLSGNVLVLFNYIEKHGDPLYQELLKAYPKRDIHLVVGRVDGDVREDIRKLVETQNNAILACSFGAFGVGVNIKKIHHIVLASPTKSRYRVLQGIGRGLRVHESKNVLYVYDIIDDIHTKEYVNYSMKHWRKRAKFYNEEQFPVEEYNHDLESRNAQDNEKAALC